MTSSASHGAAGLGTKLTSAERALAAIRQGSRVFLGTGCAAPPGLLATLEGMTPGPADLEFVSFVTTSCLATADGVPTTRYRHRTFFVGSYVRGLACSDRLDYVPICLEEVPHLLATFYRAMGIDPSTTFLNGSGRPMYILDERDPVAELI